MPSTAFSQTYIIQIPFTTVVPNSCVPEDVFIQGELDMTISQTFDSATGSHFNQHFVSKGKGQGPLTSANDNYSEETENSLQIPGPPQTIAQELLINQVLVANG